MAPLRYYNKCLQSLDKKDFSYIDMLTVFSTLNTIYAFCFLLIFNHVFFYKIYIF